MTQKQRKENESVNNQNQHGRSAPQGNPYGQKSTSAGSSQTRRTAQGTGNTASAAGSGRQSPQNPANPRGLTKEELEKRRKAAVKARKKRAAEEAKRQKALDARKKKDDAARKKAEEKMRRHDERFELTEEEKAIRDQMKREERDYSRRQAAKKTKVFIGRLFVFLLMFVLLLGISAGLFYANLVKYESSAKKNFVYHVGDDSADSVTVAHDKMMRGGTLYLNMTPIIDLCKMAVTGDSKELRYISRNAKENVQFIVGSRQVFINGVEERLTASPILEEEDLYVPYTFFTSYVSGLDLEYDTDRNRINVSKAMDPATGNDMEMTFVIRSDAPMQALDEYNEFGKTPPVAFVNDFDLYEEYMNPANRDDYLLLVNSQYPLDQNYVPTTTKVELSDMLLNGQTDQFLDPVCYKAAHAMVMELASNGYADTKIYLGYRSYTKQRTFYNSTVRDYQKTMSEEQAKIAAMSVAQEPGCNPQQAGLSFIMHNMKENSTAFSREASYGWLAENCWKFGFIIRYPADKTAETGMAFQPYFFTFVGRYHAMRIHESGLSMEEYIAQLEEKDYFNMPYADFRNQLLNKKNQ